MISDRSQMKTGLEEQLRKIEGQIREVEKRLPAHSIKSPMMDELIELEDKRDQILARLEAIDI